METKDFEISPSPQPEVIAKALRTWIETHYQDNPPVISIRIRHSVKIEFDPAIPSEHYARLHEILSTCCRNICVQENMLAIPWVDLTNGLYQALQAEPGVASMEAAESARDLSTLLTQLRAYYQTPQHSQMELFPGQASSPISDAFIRLTLIKEEEHKEKEAKLRGSADGAEGGAVEGGVPENERAQKDDKDSFVQRFSTYEDLSVAKSPIEFNKIFEIDAEASAGTNPLQRLLILGRAGIGKSTLCQYVAHQWATNQLWQDRFQAIFWISLRQLNPLRYPEGHAYDWLEVLNRECFENCLSPTEKKLLETAVTEHPEQFLFLLDGYDEVLPIARTGYLQPAFDRLRHQACCLITSRPQQTADLHVQRRLEVMGFMPEDIEKYVQKFFEQIGTEAVRLKILLDFLKRQPMIWGIAHIPLQLAMMCQLAARNQLWREGETQLTLSALYQRLTHNLFKRLLIRDGQVNDETPDVALPAIYCDIQKTLEQLAYSMMLEDTILFNQETLIHAIYACDSNTQNNPTLFDQRFKQLLRSGFIRRTSEGKEAEYYFIHLTFQEYFAAGAIARTFKHMGSLVSEAYEEMRQRVLMHRYNPRLQLVWRYVAGHLSNDVRNLQRFFDILMTESRDLLGNYERQLLVHCLAECGEPEGLRLKRDQLLEELMRMLLQDKEWDVRNAIVEALGKLGAVAVTPAVLDALLGALRNANKNIRTAAASVLGKLGTAAATPEVLDALVGVLQDEDDGIRYAAVEVLEKIGVAAATPKVLNALLGALRNANKNIKTAAASALGKLGAAAATPEFLDALVCTLQDEDAGIRYAAVKVLKKMDVAAATPEILHTLVGSLRDDDSEVSAAAAGLLGKLGAVAASEVLGGLLDALRDTNMSIRTAAADVLKKIGVVAATSKILGALLIALEDVDEGVRNNAAGVLEVLSAAATPAVLEVLQLALRTENVKTRRTAINGLRAAIKESEHLGKFAEKQSFLEILSVALHDNDIQVRYATVCVLIQFGIVPNQEDLNMLQRALREGDEDIKCFAVDALKTLGLVKMTQEILDGLLFALQNKNEKIQWGAINREKVKRVAIRAVKDLGGAALTPKILKAVLLLLASGERTPSNYYRRVMDTFENLDATPEVLKTLLIVLKDTDNEVKCGVAVIFKHFGACAASQEVLKTLLLILKDGGKNMKCFAIYVLRNLGIAAAKPEILKALLNELQDKNSNIRCIAAMAIGSVGVAAPPEVLEALLVALQDDTPYVRYAAIEGLKAMGSYAMTPVIVKALLKATPDENECAIPYMGGVGSLLYRDGIDQKKVGMVADRIFSELDSTADDSAVLEVLLDALQDGDEYVRTAAADALRKKNMIDVMIARPEVLKASLVALALLDNGILKKIGLAIDLEILFNFLKQDSVDPSTLYTAVATALAYRFSQQNMAFFFDSSTQELCCWEKGTLQRYILPARNRTLFIREIQKAWIEHIHLPITALPPPADTPLHEAVSAGNIDRVNELLAVSLADLDNQRNERGFTPLMCATQAGHVAVTRALVNAGANITAVSQLNNDKFETAMSLATSRSSKKCQRLLKLLLRHRQCASIETFQNWLDKLAHEYQGMRGSEEADQKLFNTHVGSWTAEVGLGKTWHDSRWRYLAHLDSIAGDIRIGDGKPESLEGMFSIKFLSLRIRLYVELILRIERQLLAETELPQSKLAMLVLLKAECLLMLETLNNLRDADIINNTIPVVDSKDTQTERKELFEVLASNTVDKLIALVDGEVYECATGFASTGKGQADGHAIYLLITRQKDRWIVQLNNLGAGLEKHPKCKKKVLPYWVGTFSAEELKNATFVEYLAHVLQAHFMQSKTALKGLYTTQFNHGTKELKDRWPANDEQTVGNCVVRNHNVGLECRLRLRYGNDQGNAIYHWLLQQERQLIVRYYPQDGIAAGASAVKRAVAAPAPSEDRALGEKFPTVIPSFSLAAAASQQGMFSAPSAAVETEAAGKKRRVDVAELAADTALLEPPAKRARHERRDTAIAAALPATPTHEQLMLGFAEALQVECEEVYTGVVVEQTLVRMADVDRDQANTRFRRHNGQITYFVLQLNDDELARFTTHYQAAFPGLIQQVHARHGEYVRIDMDTAMLAAQVASALGEFYRTNIAQPMAL